MDPSALSHSLGQDPDIPCLPSSLKPGIEQMGRGEWVGSGTSEWDWRCTVEPIIHGSILSSFSWKTHHMHLALCRTPLHSLLLPDPTDSSSLAQQLVDHTDGGTAVMDMGRAAIRRSKGFKVERTFYLEEVFQLVGQWSIRPYGVEELIAALRESMSGRLTTDRRVDL
ncbi:hypothetical protein Hypma_004750 [Hypsizygus marmoreus]|uniref:Uncharacterized protein n=1 Tax=Hypsizygus marmoreus TaxID=39966 RepID=A0A369J6J1_HYPMA|nr:hypothetical protein Hypma_004750 [Hypsizygus marmoreus]